MLIFFSKCHSQCLSYCSCKALSCSYMLRLKQSHSEFKYRQRAPQKASPVGTMTFKLFSAAGASPLWNVIKTFLRLEDLALSADWIKVWLLPCVDIWMLMSRLCVSRPWVMVEKGEWKIFEEDELADREKQVLCSVWESQLKALCAPP